MIWGRVSALVPPDPRVLDAVWLLVGDLLAQELDEQNAQLLADPKLKFSLELDSKYLDWMNVS
jgi:hypothetical protein